jgi:hypothetical protein
MVLCACSCRSLRACSLHQISKDAVRGLLGFIFFAFFSLLLYSRSLYPCLLSSVGMLATLEAHAAWSRSSANMPTLYMWYCMLNAAGSFALGYTMLSTATASCAYAKSPDACSRVAEVVALTLCIGSAPMAFLACVTMMFTHCFDAEGRCRGRRCCSGGAQGGSGGEGGGSASGGAGAGAGGGGAGAEGRSPCHLPPSALLREVIFKQRLG